MEPDVMKFMKHCVMALWLAIAAVTAMADGAIEKIDAVGIENYTQFDGPPGFAGTPVGFGGATQAAAMEWLKREGFTTVINLRLASEEGVDVDANRAAAEAAGLQYIHLPFDTDKPKPAVIENFLSAVRGSANQPVYIHCNSATRAAALWMIGRVLEDGQEIDVASKEAEIIALKPDAAIAFATLYIERQVKAATTMRR